MKLVQSPRTNKALTREKVINCDNVYNTSSVLIFFDIQGWQDCTFWPSHPMSQKWDSPYDYILGSHDFATRYLLSRSPPSRSHVSEHHRFVMRSSSARWSCCFICAPWGGSSYGFVSLWGDHCAMCIYVLQGSSLEGHSLYISSLPWGRTHIIYVLQGWSPSYIALSFRFFLPSRFCC